MIVESYLHVLSIFQNLKNIKARAKTKDPSFLAILENGENWHYLQANTNTYLDILHPKIGHEVMEGR